MALSAMHPADPGRRLAARVAIACLLGIFATQAWIAALRASAGTRVKPDLELREWALAQTAHEQNRPLWERLEALGVESGRLGSERVSIVGTPPAARAGRAARSPDSAG